MNVRVSSVAWSVACAVATGTSAFLSAGASAYAADPSYSLKLDVPTAAKKGQRTVVKLHVVPGTGYHMNKDFPTALTLVPPAGLTLEKPKQLGKDAAKLEEAGADFDVAFTAADAGSKVVTGELKFAVCSANSCDPKKETVRFTVTVQ
jgi:hypothetical protein